MPWKRPAISALLPTLVAVLLWPGGAGAEDYTLCNQGLKAKAEGDNTLAVKLIGLCIDHGKLRSPALAVALYQRGEAHRRLGALDKALQDFSAALRIKSDMKEAYSGRAVAFAQSGKHGLAILDYERALRLEPGSANTHYNRALSHIGNGAFEQALRDLDKVLELDPKFVGAVHYNRGVVFARLRLYDEAIKAFDASIQGRWDLAVAYFDRAVLFLRNRQYQMAVADLGNALVLKPNFGDAFAYRGLAREGLGDGPGAAGDYRHALEFGTTLDWVPKRLAPLQSKG